MRERRFGTLVTMALAALGHIAFLADVWHRVAPAWVAVGVTVAPVVLVVLGAALDGAGRADRRGVAGRACELSGALLALLFDAVIAVTLVSGGAPRGWPLFVVFAALGAPSAFAIARDHAVGPPPPRVAPPLGVRADLWGPALISMGFVAFGLIALVRGAPPRSRLVLLSAVVFFGLCAAAPWLGPSTRDVRLRTVPRWDPQARGARGPRRARRALGIVLLAAGLGLLARAVLDPVASPFDRGYAAVVASFTLLAALVTVRPPGAREPGVKSFHVAFEGLVAREAHGLTLYPWGEIRGALPAEVGERSAVRVTLSPAGVNAGQPVFRPGVTAKERARWQARRARRARLPGMRCALTIGERQCDATLATILGELQRGLGDASSRVVFPSVEQYKRRFFGGAGPRRGPGLPYRS